MHRVPKETVGFWASRGPWGYQGWRGFPGPRETSEQLVLLDNLDLQGSPVREESRGPLGTRASGDPSERPDSLDLRGLKVPLAVLEKMGPLDTQGSRGRLETEALKESEVTRAFLESEASRENGAALVKLAHLDQWDPQVQREIPEDWGALTFWATLGF